MFLSGFDTLHLPPIPSFTPMFPLREHAEQGSFPTALSFASKSLALVFVNMVLEEELVKRWERDNNEVAGGGAVARWGGVVAVWSPQLISHQRVPMKPTLLVAKVIVNNDTNTGIAVTSKYLVMR